MEALGVAASLIAVVEASAKIASICVQYSHAVKHAKSDIERLRGEVEGFTALLREVEQLLGGPNKAQFSTSQKLHKTLKDCLSELTKLEEKLSPGRRQKAMSRLGVRALKWPLERNEVNKVIDDLERYKQTVSLALQVDQTYAANPRSSTPQSCLLTTLLHLARSLLKSTKRLI